MDRSKFLIGLMALVGLVGVEGAGAQVFQPEQERKSTERGAESGRKALEAADAAEQLLSGEGGVRYADVLAAPDDLELNYRYANAQVARGDLKGAAATLERILLIAPDLPKVQLFHAIVLYRLDDLDGAEAALERVRSAELDAELAATAAEYARRIDRRQRRTRGSFSLSAGAQYDSNRNSAPRSNSLLVRDFRFELGDDAREDDDYAYLGIGELALERKVGAQEQHTLFGVFTFYNAEQERLDRFDVRSGTADVGLRYRTQPVDWTFQLSSGLVDLSSEKFVRNVAGEIRAEGRIAPRAHARALARIEYFDYDGIPDSPRAYWRTGFETTLGGEFLYTWSPSHQTALAVGGRSRSADRRFYSYYGPTAGLRHTWLPGGGQFVLGGATLDWNRYKDAQTFISTKIRREAVVRTRLLYGAPSPS